MPNTISVNHPQSASVRVFDFGLTMIFAMPVVSLAFALMVAWHSGVSPADYGAQVNEYLQAMM